MSAQATEHQSRAPQGWDVTRFNAWITKHPSPNSTCQDDMWANFSMRGTNEPSCDGRLQSTL